jgi:hypothetical protein
MIGDDQQVLRIASVTSSINRKKSNVKWRLLPRNKFKSALFWKDFFYWNIQYADTSKATYHCWSSLLEKKKSTVKGAYLNHLMQHKLQRRNRGSLPAGGSVDWFLTSTAPRPRASLVAPTWSAAAGRRLSNNHSPAAAGAAAERTLGVVRCPRRTRGPQHQCWKVATWWTR